jgi:hypothetical protein
MAENSRQKVDQWASRNPQWPVTISFRVSGPEHDQKYVYTYTLNDPIANIATPIVGEEMNTKAAAKESAAQRAFVVFELLG